MSTVKLPSVLRAQANGEKAIEVEVRDVEEAAYALGTGVDRLLLVCHRAEQSYPTSSSSGLVTSIMVTAPVATSNRTSSPVTSSIRTCGRV